MTKNLSLLLFIPIFTVLAACSGGKPTDPPDPKMAREERNGRLFGESGFSFGGNDVGGESDNGGVSVNGFLWRASLDTVSFMPINQVDPFGGVILTDWFSPADQPNERFKLNVYILSKSLRSDGIRVSAFKEIKNASGVWETAPISKEFSLKLEESILIRARQMRVSALESQNKLD